MSFELEAKRQQSKFRMTLSAEARQPTDDKGKRNGHLIALGHEIQNLYPSLRGDDGALPFFRDRKIKWWTNARSGDRPLDKWFSGPTRNMASSQIACVNYLLPLAKIREAITHFLRAIDDDVLGVVPIVDEGGRESPVEFEWVGYKRASL